MVNVNGQIFGNETFHNGETIYKMPRVDAEHNVIEMRFETDSDITRVQFATEFIRDKAPDSKITLIMFYIPYSRTDREIPEGNQMFSMKYFANIINNLEFTNIIVIDPHSYVSEAMLVNITLVNIENLVREAVDDFKPDYIIYPDKGAFEKYPKILTDLGVPFFHANKKRDLANRGAIIKDAYELVDAPDLNGKSVLIVDDLVALGGTAFITGDTLKKAGAARVGLYVSHAENGVFVGKLLDGDETGYHAVDVTYTAATTPLAKEHKNLKIVGEGILNFFRDTSRFEDKRNE